jgi:hypothetical protein
MDKISLTHQAESLDVRPLMLDTNSSKAEGFEGLAHTLLFRGAPLQEGLMSKASGIESYRLLQYFGDASLQSSRNCENERSEKNVKKRLRFLSMLGVHLKSHPIWCG